ncbi:unnamed protein product, partial [Protopolystoma xenopodis]
MVITPAPGVWFPVLGVLTGRQVGSRIALRKACTRKDLACCEKYCKVVSGVESPGPLERPSWPSSSKFCSKNQINWGGLSYCHASYEE